MKIIDRKNIISPFTNKKSDRINIPVPNFIHGSKMTLSSNHESERHE